MKYLKLFENFNDVESTKDNLYDLFIDFEDDGWNVKSDRNRIVPDRNDWTGNFQSTKVRNVWGSEFIDYNEDVIMSKGDRKWESVDCFTVNMSKTHYIENLTEESIVEHWKDLDDYIISKLPAISERAKRLGLELFGIHGKWFTLGKASHSDFSNEPHFGWEMMIDNIVFAFIPIKTNEGLFDKVYSNINPMNNISRKWNKESVFGMTLNIQPGVYIKRDLVDPTLQKISKLSKRWNLVYNSVDLYQVGKDEFIKFRFSDIKGNSDYGTESGPIPIDIREEIISEVKSELGDFVVVEDFDNRGYIYFNVSLEIIGKRIDEGLFDFFRKKPIESSPMVDTLYEPMEVPYMVEYEENHKTVPFTKSESDYIKGLVKNPSDVVYNSGPKFSANHYLVKNVLVYTRLYTLYSKDQFIIRKYDDEWFFVTVYNSKINSYKYYKCDTFDGVKQLLNKA